MYEFSDLELKRICEIFSNRNVVITGTHVVYAKKAEGWFHGEDYVNKDAIYPFVRDLSFLCRQIAKVAYHSEEFGQIDVVAGPTVGGVGLSQWTASKLMEMQSEEFDILAVFADEVDVIETKEITIRDLADAGLIFDLTASGKVRVTIDVEAKLQKIEYQHKVGTQRALKRGYDSLVKGKRCLLAEDVVNSGITVMKTAKAIREAGGIVVGVIALCDRGGGKNTAEKLGVPYYFSLFNVNMEMFPEDTCQICAEKGPESVRTDIGKGAEFLQRKGLK